MDILVSRSSRSSSRCSSAASLLAIERSSSAKLESADWTLSSGFVALRKRTGVKALVRMNLALVIPVGSLDLRVLDVPLVTGLVDPTGTDVGIARHDGLYCWVGLGEREEG